MLGSRMLGSNSDVLPQTQINRDLLDWMRGKTEGAEGGGGKRVQLRAVGGVSSYSVGCNVAGQGPIALCHVLAVDQFQWF